MAALYVDGVAPNAKVLPVVYSAILDHYCRRNDGQDRVIGTLLGTVVGNCVEITNSFPVPHNENEDIVAVDMEYHRTLYELHQRVNSKEIIVGWYATGREITEHSVLIHEFYSRETDNPVHLTIDPAMTNGSMKITAVVSTPLGVPETGTTGTMFTPIKCEMLCPEAERLGIELLQRGVQSSDSTAAGSLLTDLEHVSNATDSLQQMLDQALTYVNTILTGEKPGDVAIGRYLLDTVSAVPTVDAANFEQMFNSTLQDLLMVVYLANLTRTQVSLQEKLNSIL